MKRYQSRVPGSVQKVRLDEYLQQWLSTAMEEGISKTKIRNLIVSGSVYVNRHRNKIPTTPLYSGAVIEVYYNEEQLTLGKVKWDQTRLKADAVVYEDEWLIVINKPAGLPTQPTVDASRPNLYDLMKRFLDDREKKTDEYVGLHHRLDKDTSGIVLFTKKQEANFGVSKLFSEHQIQKTYQCLSWISPESHKVEDGKVFNVDNFLGKISAKNENSKYGLVRSGGDHAITDFKVIETFRDVAWLEARPKTGRTHQIRIHCQSEGLPILGDPIYFPEGIAPFLVVPRLMLHAYSISFPHPITKLPIQIECPLPEDFVHCLGALKK